jgi:uncharacterized protein YjiS (DUF1127 family)
MMMRVRGRQTALDYLSYSHSPAARWPVSPVMTKPSVGSVRQGKLPALMRRVIATFRSWQRNIRSRRELLQLSESELRDIGLTRVEALYEANRPFWDCSCGPTL